MTYSNKIQQEKPWAILGWTRKQWKARRLWKQAGVTEEKMSQLLQVLDHSTVQELKDYAMTELLTDRIFGSKD
jgi:hypothetical protein